jgi:hypothetical protein
MLNSEPGRERAYHSAWEVAMENDSIRASGNDTLVDIWINGKLRAICVTRDAIEAYVGSDRATDADRCEFVRTHLPLVVTSVKSKLRMVDPDSESVTIEAGQLGRETGDRRRGERRRTDRRKTTKPKEELPHGERRRSERRRSERRRPPNKPA